MEDAILGKFRSKYAPEIKKNDFIQLFSQVVRTGTLFDEKQQNTHVRRKIINNQKLVRHVCLCRFAKLFSRFKNEAPEAIKIFSGKHKTSSKTISTNSANAPTAT